MTHIELNKSFTVNNPLHVPIQGNKAITCYVENRLGFKHSLEVSYSLKTCPSSRLVSNWEPLYCGLATLTDLLTI